MNDVKNILEVKHLRVSFHTYAGEVKAVRDVSFSLQPGLLLLLLYFFH